MEVATWNGPNIHRSSWALGLRSEASGRFEKGLQPEQCLHAQALAAQLMIELCGARVVPGTIDVGLKGDGWVPVRPEIGLRDARVRAILGVSVAPERQAEILNALDFETEPRAGGLEVRVPALRRDDVTREIDLIEEVARIDGLERLPTTLPARRGAAGMLTHAQRVRRDAEDAMVGRGLYEVVGWSFTDPSLLDRLLLGADHQLRRVIELENPLSEGQSIMRPTLLGSLLDAARHNVARNGPDVAIFESGTVYRKADHVASGPQAPASDAPDVLPAEILPADEHHALGVLLSGHLDPRSWQGRRPQADFFAAKALLGGLLERFALDWSVEPATPEQWPFLHPGRSAVVLAGDGVRLGFLGELHPRVAAAWDLGHAGTPSGAHPDGHTQPGERTAAFAIDLGKLAALASPLVEYTTFGPFPALRQDLAVTLPESVPAGEALARVRGAGGELLEEVRVFDVYTGEQVGEGRRSLALALSFRAPERTLSDEDVEPLRAGIVAALHEIGGELRG